MTNIAKGRVEFLQTEVVEAIKRAENNDTLSDGGVKDIFGKLLKDPAIQSEMEEMSFKKMWEESK